MNDSKITIEFDTTYIDKENKFFETEKYIRDFLAHYFPSLETKEDIRIIVADNVHKTKRRVTGENENDNRDNSMASTTYLNGKFIMVLPIGGFRLEIFPEEAKNLTKDLVEKIRLIRNHLIYHEMQHIRNRYHHPTITKIIDNTGVISDIQTYFKVSACKFIDEYLTTVSSQSSFGTVTEELLFLGFEKLQKEMSKKFLEKTLTHKDVYNIAYFYSHIFAINKIKTGENVDGITKKIEEKLEGIEKRFFININNAIKKHLDKDINSLIGEITNTMSTFYRLGSNRKNISSQL